MKHRYSFIGIIFIVLLTFSIFQIEALAQNESIFMGGVELTLGMQKSQIIPYMKMNNFIEHQENAQRYTIWASKDKILMIGLIQFDVNNNLATVTKFWPDFSPDNYPDALEILFTLLNRYKNVSGIKTFSHEILEPKFKAKTINFYTGKRNIEFGMKENGVIYINESLRSKE